MLMKMSILQGHGFTLIYGFGRPTHVPSNTPTSIDIPFYEVHCSFFTFVGINENMS